MEALLKSLEGKTLTKKNLFDILSGININDLDNNSNNIINYDEINNISKNKKIKDLKCNACMKSFCSKLSLSRHHQRNTVCSKWISDNSENKKDVELKKGLHLIIDDFLDKSICDEHKLECKYCKSTFISRGNHHKHFNTSLVCNKMAFQEFKDLINSL